MDVLQVVSCEWRNSSDGRREVGLIAERLVEAGLGWACFYDEDGRVEGINYEFIGLTLVGYAQRIRTDLTALEVRVGGLEEGRRT